MTATIAPEGSSLSFTDGYQKQVEQIISKVPEVESYFGVVNFGGGVNNGLVFTKLKDYKDRKRTGGADHRRGAAPVLRRRRAFRLRLQPPAIGGFGKPVQFVVQNPDYAVLGATMDTFVTRARQIPGLVNIDTDLRVNKPQLTIHFDRDRAEDLGVPVEAIASTLQTMLGAARSAPLPGRTSCTT